MVGSVGDACKYMIGNWRNVGSVVVYTIGGYGSYLLTKKTLTLGFKLLEARLSKPVIIRETSKMTLNNLNR